ncbi:ABC transporter permease [Imbroritus primus]|uniref:ABC transporter permease n=1 Tax=Imbroritus primus TaxID=3058603 RepID=A0ACD3SS51_9BURK|nr:ABC transporter permease [Burkholderiaceae bacterium PBA]
MLMQQLRGLWEFRLVFSHLVFQHLTLRYRRTALGFLWTLMNPLFTMVITSVVFSLMMRMNVRSFGVFLFSGLIPWMLFSNCVSQGGSAILENEALVKKIYIPKQIFVMAKCVGLLIDALLSFVCLFLIAIFVGANITPALLVLPISFLITFLFSLGFAMVMSVAVVYFRDAQHIVGIGLQVGYYLTPIIYPISIIPEKFYWAFYYNPMYYFIELFRAPIYDGVIPGAYIYIITGIGAIISLLLGVFVFSKGENDIVFRL